MQHLFHLWEQIREVKDSGFSLACSTLEIVTLAGTAGHAQIHSDGILMVLPGKHKRMACTCWKACCVPVQMNAVVVALEGGTVVSLS